MYEDGPRPLAIAPSSAPGLPIDPRYQQQAIVPTPPPSNLALVQAQAFAGAMGAVERDNMQAQIEALRNQLSWTQSAAEQYAYEEKMRAARILQKELDKMKVKIHSGMQRV